MVEVRVARLGLDAGTNAFVVVLQERDGPRTLPIWIGRPEAEAIAVHVNQVPRERPGTHDLARALIAALGGAVRRVAITRVEHNTFFAELLVERDGAIVAVDARPSDAIAVALRCHAPIVVAEALLADAVGGDAAPAGPPPADLTPEQLQRHLEGLRPEDFGKFRL
jgi:hypothetical protein